MIARNTVLQALVPAAFLFVNSAVGGDKVNFASAKQVENDIRSAAEKRPGITWVDYADTSKYSASVIRRTAPDKAEVHQAVTDVWYVISGSGTLVTGGTLTEPVQTEPDEVRGKAISGGDSRHVAKGDIVSILVQWAKCIDKRAAEFPKKTKMRNVHVSRNGKVIGEFSEDDFRKNVRQGVIVPSDYYFCEGFKDWKSVADFKRDRFFLGKFAGGVGRERSPAYTGGLCAVVAAFLPLVSPVLFFLGSLPLLLTAFVLAIVSIVRGKVGGGLCLLVGLIFAFMMSLVCLVDRDDLLHHPEKFRSEQRR